MKHARPDYNRIQDPHYLIPEDEPVFIIRAQDSIGYMAVNFWAFMHEQNGGDPKLSRLAREHAQEMKDWPVKKLADYVSMDNVYYECDVCGEMADHHNEDTDAHICTACLVNRFERTS